MPNDHADLKTTEPPIVVSVGSEGEIMAVAPSGRVQFMGLWGYIRLAWAAARAGRNIEVRDV